MSIEVIHWNSCCILDVHCMLGGVRGIALATDLSFLVSGADDKTIALWSFKKREELKLQNVIEKSQTDVDSPKDSQ